MEDSQRCAYVQAGKEARLVALLLYVRPPVSWFFLFQGGLQRFAPIALDLDRIRLWPRLRLRLSLLLLCRFFHYPNLDIGKWSVEINGVSDGIRTRTDCPAFDGRTVCPLVPKTSASTNFATDTKMRTGVEPVCEPVQRNRIAVLPPHQPQTPALAGVCLLCRLLLLEHPALWRALEDVSAIMQIG